MYFYIYCSPDQITDSDGSPLPNMPTGSTNYYQYLLIKINNIGMSDEDTNLDIQLFMNDKDY